MKIDPMRFIKVRPGQRVNMTAIIFSGGNIVSIGHNDFTRLSYNWKEFNQFRNEQGMHAEVDAILKWKNRKPGSMMVIMGYTRAGNLLECCKPCNSCMKAIRAIGKISKIKYIENGEWIIRKVE